MSEDTYTRVVLYARSLGCPASQALEAIIADALEGKALPEPPPSSTPSSTPTDRGSGICTF